MNEGMIDFRQNIENLISKERIESYGSIEKHFENLYLVANITPKLASLEIALRNTLDFYFKQSNQNWILDSNSDVVKTIRDNKTADEQLDHHQILSRFTLGEVIRIISEHKLQNEMLTLYEFDFTLYSSSNRNFCKINGQKVSFSNIDKVNIVLSLLQNIRNRSYHWENLLKIRESKGKYFPRITTKLHETFIGIEPEQICSFLNELLIAFNKDMIKLTNLK